MEGHHAPPGTEREARELEWQFDAVDLRPVGRWLSSREAGARPSVGPGHVREHLDTYWDTDDWRLYRAGWSVRTREASGAVEATMKGVGGEHGDRRDRPEITARLPDDRALSLLRARGPLGERLRSLVGRRPLRRLFEVETRRRAFPVLLDDGQVAELALDETVIPVPSDDRPVRLQRVEVELTGEEREEVLAFVEELRAACGLTPAGASKFETGLLATGVGPPPPLDLGPTDIDAGQSIGEFAFAVLRRQFAAMLAHEPGARTGDDPEEVHDMRVAIRRMRAAIRLFEAALPVRARSFERELKWVGTALGAVRDLDVEIQQWTEWAGELEAADRGALAPALDDLERRRADARRELLRSLDSRRYDRLVAGLSGMLQRGPLRRASASRVPVLLAAPDVVRTARSPVRRRSRTVSSESSAEELHRLRIKGKRFRYAVEFLEPIYGKPAGRLATRLSDMQDVLGSHQDARVAMEQVGELVRSHAGLPAETVFVLGRLAERYWAAGQTQRSRVERVVRRTRGKPWRSMQHAMDEGVARAEVTRTSRTPAGRSATRGRTVPAASSAVPA